MLLDDAKKSVRASSSYFDTEIQDLIDAAKIDLNIAGVNKIEDTDPLVKRAVILYVKANFGSSDDSEQNRDSYNMLKSSLALSSKYNTQAEESTDTEE